MSRGIKADLDPKEFQRMVVEKLKELSVLTDLPSDAPAAQIIARLNRISKSLRELLADTKIGG